ncbi:MAG: DUF1553 domain-containing protein [Pirellulaceae bacterium]|nr:DUF1553 domain-containing protein [Pirellulaceae bacterium]
MILELVAHDVDGDGVDDGERAASAVAIWKDRSGQGNHFAQRNPDATPQAAPTSFGNATGLRFDGNDLLSCGAFKGIAPGDQPFHLMFVMSGDRSRNNPRLFDLSSVADNKSISLKSFWVGYQADGVNRLGVSNGDEATARSVAWDEKPHLVEVVYHGDQRWSHFLDGRPDGEGTYSAKPFQGFSEHLTANLGQHVHLDFTHTYFSGRLGAVVGFNRALERSAQHAWQVELNREFELGLPIGPIPHFERDVRPLLLAKCGRCHGEKKQESDVDLRTLTSILQGPGGALVVRGSPEQSELFGLVKAGKMPPDDEPKLTAQQISLLRRWIEYDAPADELIAPFDASSLIAAEDRDFWSFQPLTDISPPDVGDAKADPIDRFLLARLRAKQIGMAPAASKRELLRRVYLDVIGLPPTPEQSQAFLKDGRPDAYERLIDQLLASPHFGERWGRHWLDWAGYVDVYGADNDAEIIKPLEGKWRYRDYVVKSFNEDVPFDRFVREQLAGDEMVDWRKAENYAPETVKLLTATGFLLAAADDTDSPELNTLDIRHKVLEHTGEIVANNLLALTMQCAKCHHHKYEPIPQHDYYRWQAVFAPVFNPDRWTTVTSRGIPDVSATEKRRIDGVNAAVSEAVEKLTMQRDALSASIRERAFQAKVKLLPQQLQKDVVEAVRRAAKERSEIQKYLVDKFGESVAVTDAESAAERTDDEAKQLAEFAKLIGDQQAKAESYATIQVAVESGKPGHSFVLRRGDYLKPGLEVQPGMLNVLTDPANATFVGLGKTESSGRRLWLAEQLTAGDSNAGGLLARVFVNRLWQQLFGRGIVATSDNFGKSGSAPTHPQLLDWLARDFVTHQWRIKRVVRRILLSRAYRQSNQSPSLAGREQDPENNLLWRFRLRRLDSEVIRDSMLAASGKLDPQLGGPPLPLEVRPDGKVVVKAAELKSPDDRFRRSLYVLARRNYHLSMLGTFDQPVIATNCTYRQPSAVVTQALALLNDEFSVEQAESVAERIDSGGARGEAAIEAAFQLILCRPADATELQWSQQLIDKHAARYRESKAPQPTRRALAHLCQMLFNTNEFLYVH